MTTKNKIGIAVILASVAVSGTALAVDWAKHPHLKAAKEKVESAKASLKEANDHEKSEFGGHRAKAEKLLDEAKAEIDAAAEWAETHK